MHVCGRRRVGSLVGFWNRHVSGVRGDHRWWDHGRRLSWEGVVVEIASATALWFGIEEER